MTELLSQLLLILFLFLACAFFSASETSLFSLGSIQKRRIGSLGTRRSRTIFRLLQNPRRTLIAILIGTNLVHVLLAATSTTFALRSFGPAGVGLLVLLITLLLILFGEIVPKTYAVGHNEGVANWSAIPLDLFAKAISPFRRAVRWLTDFILSFLIREKSRALESLSEGELSALIEIGREEGVLETEEARRLTKLFELGERSVKEIMTPRTELIGLDMSLEKSELIEIIRSYHYTYFPVYKDSLDQIVGVISTQVLMLNPEKKLEELVHPPYFVPATKRIDDLLFEMRKTKIHSAICVDEFGGTAGLVTQEDIFEEIFGEIYDEYSTEESLIKRIGRDEYLVEGKIPLKDFNEKIGADFSSRSSGTLGGLILEKLGRIPKLKETFPWGGFLFEIREIDKQRIAKVMVKRLGAQR